MKKVFNQIPFVVYSVLLLAAAPRLLACGQSGVFITNLPALNGTSFSVYGLNATGQVAGYFYVNGQPGPHAFIYGSGGLTDLGTLGGSFGEAFAINGPGQAVGDSSIDGDSEVHAVISVGTNLFDLGTLGGTYSSANAINDSGLVVGSSTTQDDAATEAFLFAGGLMYNLGDLGGGYGEALAINNAGQIVGKSQLENMEVHAFSSWGGPMTDLGTLGGDYSSALALNQSGVVVGEASLANGRIHGFVFSGGVMHDVGTLGGTQSSALQINAAGQVLGTARTAAGSNHSFVYSNGIIADLGTLGGDYTYPWAINNNGWAVGVSTTSNGTFHAFLWQAGTMVDLNSLLPVGSGWELRTAEQLNDSGRIVGQGTRLGVSLWYIMDFVASASAAPTVVAGPSQVVECPGQATLDGSQSASSDGSLLSFEWSGAGVVLGTAPTLTSSFPLGTNEITLKVTDACGAASQTNLEVVVVDTTPPLISGSPASLTVPADANCQGVVPNVLASIVATDGCTPPNLVTMAQSPEAGTVLNVGHYIIRVTAVDVSGNAASKDIPLTIAHAGPATYSVSVDLASLAPPNHRIVPVAVSVVASDICHATPTSKIISITANESVSPGDIQITGGLTAALAASRNPSGPGRIYTITVQSLDDSGQVSNAAVTVSVPKGADGSNAASNTGKATGRQP